MDEVNFGRYRLLEVLRLSSVGTIYRAHDTVMNREVAIKVILPELAADPVCQQRFRNEASIAAQLNDPNIIPVYEAGEIDGRQYLVMPVIDGIDLDSMLRRDGAMSPALAVRIVEQCAAALEAAHGSGLVHGDVKSSNVFVVGGEFVYLVDFGSGADADTETDTDGDVYGLAQVLYECLTGQPAGYADNDAAVPPGFVDVLARALAQNPADRFITARELATAAREAISDAGAPVSANEVEFGRYRLFELLGQGGMGSVYRAHDTVLGRDVAVKLLRPELASEPGYQERFRREAYAAGRLASPNIIPIFEAGELNGRLYLVMPVIDGVDVHTLLSLDGPMAPKRAVRIVEQVAAALDTAHRAGLVHRDVKPSNVLMVGDDFAYLIDFGLVHDEAAARLTQTNIVPGTPAYMAPERLAAEAPADARGDVYSLACVLYECLTAQLPFSGSGVEAMVVAHLQADPPKPSSFAAAIPSGFDAVIARGMAKNPDERYQSAADLADAARSALATQTAVTEPPLSMHATATAAAVPSRSRRWRAHARAAALAVALTAVVAVLAVAIIQLIDNRFRPPATEQLVLPFTGLDRPTGVAVDAAGNVFVVDAGHGRVVELAVGSVGQTVVPFQDLDRPVGIAVDGRGTVVVSESGGNRVLELAAGSSGPAVVPFTDLAEPAGVAIGGQDGNPVVYVADSLHNRVLTMRAGEQAELPLSGLAHPSAVAVNGDDVLFVIDRDNERVLKLPSTATVATVLPYAVGRPDFVAVDSGGDLYVTDSRDNRVMRLAKASNTVITLPFNGIRGPQGIAVDPAGTVYVVDSGNNRVLKLRRVP